MLHSTTNPSPTSSQQIHERPCDTCRRRKVRCDRTFPKCIRCIKFQYCCSYADIPKKRGPPKGYGLKRGINYLPPPNVNYYNPYYETASLNGFDHQFRENMFEPFAEFDPFAATTNNNRVVSNLIMDGPSNNNPCQEVVPVRANFKSDVIRILLSNSTIDIKQQLFFSNTGRIEYFGDSPMAMLLTMYTLHHSSPESLSSLYHHTPSQIPLSNTAYSKALTVQHIYISRLCIEAYFTYFHPYFPVIHKRHFLTNLKSQPPHLLNIVCAIGSGYLPQISQEYRDAYSDRAVHYLKLCYGKPCLSTMTTFMLMANYQHSPKEFNKGWTLLGYAIRMGYAMGLDRSPCKRISSDEVEIRSRLWWWAHIMDKLYAFSLNRPWTQDCRLSSPSLPSNPNPDRLTGTQQEEVAISCSLAFTRHLSELCHLMCLMVRRFKFTEAQPDANVSEMEFLAQATALHLDLWLTKVNKDFTTIYQVSTSTQTMVSNFVSSLHLIYYGTLVQLYQSFTSVSALSEHYHQHCSDAANSAISLASIMSCFNSHSISYKFYALSSAIMIQIRNTINPNPTISQSSRTYLLIGLGILKRAEAFYPLASECFRLAILLAKAEGIQLPSTYDTVSRPTVTYPTQQPNFLPHQPSPHHVF